MDNLITLCYILTPLFIGYLLPINQTLTTWADRLIGYLVFIILTYIGIELAQINNLFSQIPLVAKHVLALNIATIGFGILATLLFDKIKPWQHPYTKKVTNKPPQQISMKTSFMQLSCILIGFIIGQVIPDNYLPPDFTMTALLMILILMVGVGLKGSGISLKEVLLNKRGVQISVVFSIGVLIGGAIYALIMPDVGLFKGLALASGFGWYSLSAIVMTDAYGAVWGSIALLNDLIREFFALVFIPVIMRQSVAAGISVGGATSLDFTLPTIQQSGGLQVVPITISFGFIINIISPVLMVFFSSLG